MSTLADTFTLEDRLLADLTAAQREAIVHDQGPLLIIAGAGTGKTTVITRRIAWLMATKRAKPEEILALTFTDKAAAEMEARVDVLVPYGYLDIWISTFHAFGDRLLREHALEAGLSPNLRVLSKPEQIVFLREHVFELPLERLRPLTDPDRYLPAIATVISRAKDEAVTVEEFLAFANDTGARAAASPEDVTLQSEAVLARELAGTYEAYQRLLRESDAVDFGDQVQLLIQLFERHPELLEQYRRRFRYVLVDEFQDTNFAQFRLLQLFATPAANVTVVADDDQSIYKWRGAAISNVLKFLEHYQDVKRVVLTENFRSSQAILDAAYRLIRFNDPDRLEVKEQINKRLIAMRPREAIQPKLQVFDTASSEADWVAKQIEEGLAAGRKPGDFAILVRTNQQADLFLRALNVCGIPWRFSGSSGLFAHDDVRMLLSCLKTLADPEDSLSWYHVLSSELYSLPMQDLAACLAQAKRTNKSLKSVFGQVLQAAPETPPVSEEAKKVITAFMADVQRLLELSRTHAPGQLLYRWLTETGWLKRHATTEQAGDVERLQVAARFFDQLYRFEHLLGNRLPELMRSLELLRALGDVPPAADDEGWAADDRVNVLTIHKAKGLEFPVVFLVGLVQGRFPTSFRREALELPEPLIKDLLPLGNYHLQEERRLFYVGMTRAKEVLDLTAAYDYGGKSVRKVSQFVLEALQMATPTPPAAVASLKDRLERVRPASPVSIPAGLLPLPEPLRLDAHGLDDYLTCPMKFKFSHVLRIPIMRHHLVIYGAALHKAVEVFYKRQLQGKPVNEEELLQVFEQAWSSEGFLTQEHERRRLAKGRDVLRAFFAKQRHFPEQPTLIEEKFSIQVDDFVVVGRWDRVDRYGDEVVIIDYKSSDVTDQKKADQCTRESLQLAVYALAWHTIHGQLPTKLELRFLETGLVGRAEVETGDLEETKEKLRSVAKGVRALEFHAQPEDMSCRWCAYQAVCSYSTL